MSMQFVRREAGRYYMHQVDREYALAASRTESLPMGMPTLRCSPCRGCGTVRPTTSTDTQARGGMEEPG